MSVRSTLALTFIIFAALLAGIVSVASLLVRNQRDLAASEVRRYQSYKLADELRQTSDDLTRLARTYVVTGDPQMEAYFQEVVRIRNGEAPRPDNYNGIYWDFVLATGQRPGSSGDPVALETLMKRMQFTEEEFLKLRESKAKSDALVVLEEQAMNAVKGIFNDPAGEPTVKGEPDPEMARGIMFGRDYHQAKAEIMKPIGEFMVMLDERTAREVGVQQSKGRLYGTLALVLAAATLVFTLVSFVVLYRRIMVPVRKLVGAAELVKGGEYGRRVDHSSTDELGNLAESFNHMANAIEEDIGQLKKQEEEIRDNERRFRTLVDNLPGTVYRCLHDADWTMKFISEEVEELTGHPPGDFVDNSVRSFDSVILAEDRAMVAEKVEEAVLRREPWALHYRILHRDGEVRWVGERGRASFSGDGEVLHLDGVIADITERKRIEEELHRSNFLSDIALELTNCGFWHVDYSDPDYYYQSDRAAGMLGEPIKPDRRYHLQDEWFARLVEANPEAAEHTAERYQGAIDGRYEHYESTYAYKRPLDGAIIWLHALGKVVRDKDNRIQFMYGVYQDVTQRLANEEALREAKHAAESATRAKSEFLSHMSHELRTPLNGVLGYAQILQRDSEATPTQKENLDAIVNCADHLLSLINDVLDLSKIEAGRMEADLAPSDLHLLIDSVDNVVRQRATGKGISFEVEISPEVPRGILTDAGKLRQILVNLLGNAVKFTAEGGVVLHVAESPRGSLRFDVRDSGVGMDEGELAEIFDPFKQVEAGKAAGGTGLGLAITRQLAESLGGEISVESEKGSGSTFSVTLPLEEAEGESLGKLEAEGKLEFGAAVLAPGQSVDVLVADDRETNRDILKKMLEEAGFGVRLVDDGDTALEALREEKPDMVLMDVRMPRMNGIEALKEIRADEDLKDLKVIAVTASVFPAFKQKAIEEGFDDFLGKPFRTGELMVKLKHHLDLEFVTPQEDEAAEADGEGGDVDWAGIPPELLDDLRAALKIKNLTAINGIAGKLKENAATKALGDEVGKRARAFDFAGLEELVNEQGTGKDG